MVKRDKDKLLNAPLERAVDLSHQYYEKFPEDVDRMQKLARYLAQNEVKTYTGGKLSPSRLRALGIFLAVHGTNSLERILDCLELTISRRLGSHT